MTIRIDNVRETPSAIMCTASYGVDFDGDNCVGCGDVELCRLTGECVLQPHLSNQVAVFPGNTDTKQRIRTYIVSASRAAMAYVAARLKQTPIYFHYVIDKKPGLY